MKTIDQPEPNDVLCGRERESIRHTGNDFFRNLIVKHANSYNMASTKQKKSDVVMLVAEVIISRGGRFLIRNSEGDDRSWQDGGLKQGKKKVGHALRDAVRGRVSKCLRAQCMKRTQVTMVKEIGSSLTDDMTHKPNARNDFSPSLMYAMIEPSKDWMTASVDAELATYLRNLFFIESLRGHVS